MGTLANGNVYSGQQQASSQVGHSPNNDVRQNHVFTEYGAHGYPAPAHGSSLTHMVPQSAATASSKPQRARSNDNEPRDLFPDLPDAKKRKFILVDDNVRGSRLRVRVTLDGVDTNEIPDSFRKGASVFPRSYFPREMQSPPPSATGSQFFPDDASDDGIQETEGRSVGRRGASRRAGQAVKVPMGDSKEGEVFIPRTKQGARGREVRLNDLGYRMAWLQSRVFSGRTIFLQRARKYTFCHAFRP